MGLVEPVGLLAGLLALPIVALWILRPRRRERTIGSTLLWRQAQDNVRASRPWQRLRWHALLALQLVAIALVALSLAHPVRLAAGSGSGDVFVLLDASASMQATDVSPSRFAQAKRLVEQTIDGLTSGAHMTIVLMGDEPKILVARSDDRDALRRALDAANPSNHGANLAAALALISPLANQDPQARVLVYSDGGTEDASQLGILPFSVQWIRVGGPAENVAIAAFATRRAGASPTALARIVNYGSRPSSGEVDLLVDGRLFDTRPYRIAPGSEASETWTNLPPRARTLEARLPASDAFPLDNHAFAVVSADSRAQVLLVTSGNPFLAQALKLNPEVDLRVVDRPSDQDSGDVVVYDGVLPDQLPRANVLLVHPPVGNVPWLIGADRAVGTLRVVGSSEVDRFVDLAQVHVRATRAMTPAADAETVIADSSGPLVVVGNRDRERLAVIGFDLHESDFPLDPSFPILIDNIVDWLKPGSSAATRSAAPEQPVDVIPWPAATRVALVRPDGTSETLAPPFPARPIVDADQPGIYRVVQSAPGQPDRVSAFAVNLFSPRESALTPPSGLPVSVAAASLQPSTTLTSEDVWPWVVGALLLVVVAEWIVYRRVT